MNKICSAYIYWNYCQRNLFRKHKQTKYLILDDINAVLHIIAIFDFIVLCHWQQCLEIMYTVHFLSTISHWLTNVILFTQIHCFLIAPLLFSCFQWSRPINLIFLWAALCYGKMRANNATFNKRYNCQHLTQHAVGGSTLMERANSFIFWALRRKVKANLAAFYFSFSSTKEHGFASFSLLCARAYCESWRRKSRRARMSHIQICRKLDREAASWFIFPPTSSACGRRALCPFRRHSYPPARMFSFRSGRHMHTIEMNRTMKSNTFAHATSFWQLPREAHCTLLATNI